MHRRALLVSAGLLLAPLAAHAQARDVSVTIYNSNLALVEDAPAVPLNVPVAGGLLFRRTAALLLHRLLGKSC